MLAADQQAPLLAVASEPALKICLLGYRSNPYSGGQGIYIKFLSSVSLELLPKTSFASCG